jgi:hypothetical protein
MKAYDIGIKGGKHMHGKKRRRKNEKREGKRT